MKKMHKAIAEAERAMRLDDDVYGGSKYAEETRMVEVSYATLRALVEAQKGLVERMADAPVGAIVRSTGGILKKNWYQKAEDGLWYFQGDQGRGWEPNDFWGVQASYELEMP